MGRPNRCFVEGIYHVGSHASDTRHLFRSDDDRACFLDRLALTLERFSLGVVSYALLGTHYHAILRTPDARISRALQQLHTWYSRTQNRRRRRSAHLFRAHFFAREIESDEDLLTACRYVANNPIEAGLCRDAFAWRWSSAPATAGLTPPHIPLDDAPLRAALGDAADWRARYRRFVAGEPA